MKVRLLDYLGKEHFVEVPNDTDEICISVISGDMVMTSPVHYDTSNDRLVNYNDGCFHLRRDEFNILESVETTGDFIIKMYDWD